MDINAEMIFFFLFPHTGAALASSATYKQYQNRLRNEIESQLPEDFGVEEKVAGAA